MLHHFTSFHYPRSTFLDHIRLKISDLSSGSLGRTLILSASISSKLARPAVPA